MKYPKGRIIVFTKAPIQGQVKTRLSNQHLATFSVALHKSLTMHCLATVTGAELCPVQLWCSPDYSHPFFQQCQKDFKLTLFQQDGHDLGQRLWSAFETALTDSLYVIIVGTDCPYLTTEYLNKSLQFLRDGGEAVLGPAHDGGYVLIGLRRSSKELFSNISWSSEKVLAETKQKIRSLDFSYLELDSLGDVDRPEDLILLHKKAKSMSLHKNLVTVLDDELGRS